MRSNGAGLSDPSVSGTGVTTGLSDPSVSRTGVTSCQYGKQPGRLLSCLPRSPSHPQFVQTCSRCKIRPPTRRRRSSASPLARRSTRLSTIRRTSSPRRRSPSRAGELTNLLDSMTNGVNTLKAADNGLTSITTTIQSMQATVTQARQDASWQIVVLHRSTPPRSATRAQPEDDRVLGRSGRLHRRERPAERPGDPHRRQPPASAAPSPAPPARAPPAP